MSDFDPLVTLMEANGEFEARMIVAVLEEAGIEAHVFVLGNLGLPMPLSPGSRGTPVQVRKSALEAARAALKENRELGASVDWDSVDVGAEPPFLPRRRSLRSFVRLAAMALLIGGAASAIAAVLGANMSVTARVFMISCVATLIVTAILEGMREWNSGDLGGSDR